MAQLFGVYRNGTITVPEGTQALVGLTANGTPDTSLSSNSSIGKVGLQVGGADVSDTNAVPSRSSQITLTTVTIANGASLSGGVDLGTGRLVGIIMPASWTTAALTFQANADGGATYYDLYDDATERTISSTGAAVSRFLALPISDWLGVRGIKVRSGTGALAVNQGAARTITLVVAN